MIPAGADIAIVRLDPHALSIDDTDHAAPIEPWAIEHYERLLREQPQCDTDPILVCVRDGRLYVRRGRHRLLANRQAGRRDILAMVYEEHT